MARAISTLILSPNALTALASQTGRMGRSRAAGAYPVIQNERKRYALSFFVARTRLLIPAVQIWGVGGCCLPHPFLA